MRNKTINNEIKRKLNMLSIYVEKFNQNVLKNLFNSQKKNVILV